MMGNTLLPFLEHHTELVTSVSNNTQVFYILLPWPILYVCINTDTHTHTQFVNNVLYLVSLAPINSLTH